MDELKRPGGAFHLPHGKLLVNKTKSVEVYYDSFMEPVYVKPGESKFVQTMQGLDLSTFFLSPELWNARQAMDELLKGKERITVLIDAHLVDKYGDAIMLSVIPKAYKLALEDKVDVFVLSHKNVVTVWQHNPYVAVTLLGPSDTATVDLTVDVNNLETKWKEGTFSSEKKYMNRTEVYLENLGLALLNKTPVYEVTEKERKEAKELFRDQKGPIIGVARYSAAKCRTYPRMQEVAGLLSKNYAVYQLDDQKKDGTFYRTFEEMAALVEQCDLIVTADSAILHLAGALKKRVVGVFGGTGGKVFTEDYEKASIVQAPCPTGTPECWWTVPCLPGETYKEKMEAGEARCLQELDPMDVVSVVEDQLTKPRKVFVLMLTYNLLDMTKKALESIRSWNDYQIFVVDNESTDGTQDWLKANGYDFVSKRCGVASAINIGFRKFLESDCQYVLLLNNDVALRSDTIEELFVTMDESKAYAVMSDPKGSVPPWSIDWLEKPFTEFETISEIPAGSYSCTLFTRECVEKVGLFHERFRPRYIEDNDYTLRLRGHGGTFVRSFNSMYYHVLGAVVKTNDTEKKTVNRDWDANVGIFQEMWGFHPHDRQDLKRLGLEWKKKLTGKSVVDDIQASLKTRDAVNITIRRNMGGWGDILFTTVIGRELDRMFGSKVRVSYAVPENFWSMYDNLPYIRSLKPPFAPSDYDITDLEFRVELHETGEQGQVKTPRTQIYLETFGLPIDNLKPDYIVSESLKARASEIWEGVRGSGKKVVVVPEASNRLKTWPYIPTLVTLLQSKNYRVFVLQNIPTFKEAAAIVEQADLVISPDTGISNVAAALDVPTLTIFGHRNGEVFARMFKTLIPIQGHCQKNFCDFDVPCFGGGPHRAKENIDVPECLKNLSVEEVLEKAEALL